MDGELKANATKYSNKPRLSAYYKDNTTEAPTDIASRVKSPIKNTVQKIQTAVGAVTSDDEAPKKASRRKTTGATSDAYVHQAILSHWFLTSCSAGSSESSALAKSPGQEAKRRSSILQQASEATSPAKMTAAWDEGKRRVTESVSKAYTRTSISEYVELTRDNLSSPAAVNMLAWAFELYHLGHTLMPNKKITQLPAYRGLFKENRDLSGPNVFMILEPTAFWAPFTLWLLTSMILPAIASYFINIPLKAKPAPAHATRTSTSSGSGSKAASPVSSPLVSDWFMFNLAKGLICYFVYADHVQLFGLFSNYTIATVNEAVYGGVSGMITASGVGAAAALYEAVLKS